jgi:homoserine O-acetyltransferase
VQAIRADPDFAGGDYYGTGAAPLEGMALARGIGQVSYRTADELEQRFGRRAQPVGETADDRSFAVESYLRHHGQKLGRWFDPNSYVVLSQAMNHHDVGRGRGGVARALAGVGADVTVAGIGSDRLYPIGLQHELARLLPGHRPVSIIESASGHDGFLVEPDQVGAVVSSVLGA